MRTRVGASLVATLAVTIGLAPGGIAHAAIPPGPSGFADVVRGADPSGLPGGLRPLAISAVDANDVWLVGRPSYAASPAMFEHWDGVEWHRVTVPAFDNSSVDDVAAVSSDDGWAVGRFGRDRILHWNGTTWQPMQVSGLPASTQLVSVSANGPADVWAVGQRAFGSLWRSIAVHWDGSAWTVMA